MVTKYLLTKFSKIDQLTKMGGGGNSDDEDFIPDSSENTSEDEMDGRSLDQILSDSRDKKAKRNLGSSKGPKSNTNESKDCINKKIRSTSEFPSINSSSFSPNYFTTSSNPLSLNLAMSS